MSKNIELTTELRAMTTCVQALQILTRTEQQRVMRYLHDRYVEHPTLPAPAAPKSSIAPKHNGRARKILELMSDGQRRTSQEIGKACGEPNHRRVGSSLAALVASNRLQRLSRGEYAMPQQ